MQGTGTKADPFIVTTRAELASMSSNKSAFYKLGNDIDLGTGVEWVPIGSQPAPFTGGFDGDGYVIKNLYVHSGASNNYTSLFGNCSRESTEVRNLGLEDVDLYRTGSDLSIAPIGVNVKLVDNCYATGTAECAVSGGSSGGYLFASGLVIKGSVVTNSWSSVNITFSGSGGVHPDIGGIDAEADSSTSAGGQRIECCYYTGTITHVGESSSFEGKGLGGILDANSSLAVTVDKAVMLGSISTTKSSTNKGRIAPASSSGITCTNCYAADTITGYSPVGANTKNGADVNVSEYTTKTFWENTVGYDFVDDWYWDSNTNRPIQKVFIGVAITVTGDSVVALGDTSNFTATCTDTTVTTFSWNYGDGTTESGGASVQHTYDTAGSYTVTASASGADGTLSTKVIGVTISGDGQFANGVPHTLIASGTPSGGSYTWSDGDSGATHTKTYTGYEDGQTVTLTCTYTLEGVSTSASKTITCVKGTVTLSSSSLSPQLTDTISLTTTYSGSETPSNRELKHSTDGVNWTDLVYSSPYSYTFSDTEPTTHYFKVEITLPIEGTISDTITVTTSSVTVTITGDRTVALGESSRFTAKCSDPSIYRYTWDFGDGSSTAGIMTISHTYTTAGIYTVTATAEGGISGSFETRVIVVSISGDEHFANEIEHTITAVGTVPNEGTYSWSDGEIGAHHTKTYSGYEDGDTIPLTVTYTLDGVSVTASKTLVCVKGTLTLSSSTLTPSLTDTVFLTTTYSGSEVPTNKELKHSLDGTTWTSLGFSSPYAYTFSDDEDTIHYFKVEFTLPVEGVISQSITLATTTRGVQIISPEDYSAVFVGDGITFTASTAGLTDPTFLWSDGHTEASFNKSYSSVGLETMSVTATGVEGTFTASVTIEIIPIGDFTVKAPETFSNNVPVTFEVEGSIPDVTAWEFPDGEDEGTTVTRTFTGFTKGAILQVYVTGEYIDDLGHSHLVTHDTSLICTYPASYYENPRGEKFYFDSACKILREGKSGFSEIQINTDVITGHNYNSVSGLTTNNRMITFNIYVKGDYATMHAKRREMVHIMSPQKELGTFSYTRDDGEIFTMRCNIALGYPIFSDEAVSNGWVGTISFVAPNGVWEGAEITATTDDVISNIGDIPCGFEATLTGNVMNATNSEQMRAVSGTLSGYKINTANGTVMKEVDGEWVDGWEDISLNSTLVNLEVGNNTITGCSSVTFKPLYLGV